MKIAADHVKLKRAYEPPDRADGTSVLVDRIWPRGVCKDKAAVDLWLKNLAPSTELRKWFGHDPERWPEFRKRSPPRCASIPRSTISCASWRSKGLSRSSIPPTTKSTTMPSCCEVSCWV